MSRDFKTAIHLNLDFDNERLEKNNLEAALVTTWTGTGVPRALHAGTGFSPVGL